MYTRGGLITHLISYLCLIRSFRFVFFCYFVLSLICITMRLLSISCCRLNDGTLQHPFEIKKKSMYIVFISICSFRAINIARLIMFVQRISVSTKQNKCSLAFYYLSILIINFPMIGFIEMKTKVCVYRLKG